MNWFKRKKQEKVDRFKVIGNSGAPDTNNLTPINLLLMAQFQKFVNGKMGPFDLGLEEVGGDFSMIGDNQHRVSRRGIVKNDVASFLTQGAVSDFGKDFDGLTAGDISECAHRTSGKLHGHEMSAVCFLRDLEVLLLGRLKIACDGFANIGHSFRNGFPLRHAARQTGAFSDIAVVFGVIDKLNFEFHDHFLLCNKKNIITPLARQGVKIKGAGHGLA